VRPRFNRAYGTKSAISAADPPVNWRATILGPLLDPRRAPVHYNGARVLTDLADRESFREIKIPTLTPQRAQR